MDADGEEDEKGRPAKEKDGDGEDGAAKKLGKEEGKMGGLMRPLEKKDGGDDEDGSTGMCRVCAVGILSTVAAKWGPSGEAGGKDPSFLLLTLRVLFAFVLCPPRGPVRAGEWCR